MTFNPFEKMSHTLLNALRNKGKRWLVSQTLLLSFEGQLPEEKIFILLSHYEDQGMATVHLKAVNHDKYAALIDLDRPSHQEQMAKLLAPESRYLAYSSLIRNKSRMEKVASDLYREKYWKYIQQHSKAGIHPHKSLRPSMQLIFGEIFIVLKYGAETLRTRLADIEKM